VSYQIYQSTQYQGQNASPFTLLGSVAKGVQHYTAAGYTDNNQKVNLLWLELRPVYSVENTFRNASIVMFDIAGSQLFQADKRNFGNNLNGDITEYKLYENFPNPFNPSTEIYYQLPAGGNVKLKVYNVMGQEVMTLVDGFKEKGMYSVTFNAGSLASGMYIYKLEAGNYTQVKKMILTK